MQSISVLLSKAKGVVGIDGEREGMSALLSQEGSDKVKRGV